MSDISTSDYLKNRDSEAGRPTTSNGPKLTPEDLLPHIAPHFSHMALGAQLAQLNAEVKATNKEANSKIDPTNPIPPKNVNSKSPQKLPDNKHIDSQDDRDL